MKNKKDFISVFHKHFLSYFCSNYYLMANIHLKSKLFNLAIVATLLLSLACVVSGRTRNTNHLVWGHYRPHRLSIVTQRSPSPLSAGFFISEPIPFGGPYQHFAMHFRDQLGVMKNFLASEYTFNDGAKFSQQYAVDNSLNMTYNITFIKSYQENGPEQSWVYLIEPIHPERSAVYSTVNTYAYISGETLDGKGLNYFQLLQASNNRWLVKATDFATNKSKGFFEIELIKGENLPSQPIQEPEEHLSSDDDEGEEEEEAQIPEEELDQGFCRVPERWNLKPKEFKVCKRETLQATICFMDVPPEDAWQQIKHVQQNMKYVFEIRGMGFDKEKCKQKAGKFNLAVLQVRGPYRYKIKITYHSERIPPYKSLEEIHQQIPELQSEFLTKLDRIFPIDVPQGQEELRSTVMNVRKAGVSNILGGLCYTYGQIYTKADISNMAGNQEKKALFSSSPSRKSFPRGFLWDEGFHLLIICRWDRALCLEILESWFETISPTGWIPREQTRGAEQESAFHDKKFLYQDEEEANPPTLLLALDYLMTATSRSDPEYENMVEFLSSVEKKVLSWFEFFNRTQRNFEIDNDPNFSGPLFRWKCAEPCRDGSVMGSGFDDYPRAEGNQEPIAHLDLQVWMTLMVKTINQIAHYKQETPSPVFAALERKLMRALEEFRDPEDDIYKDILQDLSEKEHGVTKKVYNNHIGYINLFPLLFGFIPRESDALRMALGMIIYPEALWSVYGIRSLAMSDDYFQKGDQYWTEPIWMNINYLLLRAFEKYYKDVHEAPEISRILKANLVKVVSENFKHSYTFWENYSSLTGKGQRSSSFYGWTALIVLILSDMY